MSYTASAAQKVVEPFDKLQVSGRLITLDKGLYCVTQEFSASTEAAYGLLGMHLSLPPSEGSQPEAAAILTLHEDGWLQRGSDAALVRVLNGPAQILVTVYQSPSSGASIPPNPQVICLLKPADRQGGQASSWRPTRAVQQVADVLAHVQGQGDVGGPLGAWIGVRGSKRRIEGFAITPIDGIPDANIEYQAVLGPNRMSPWVKAGEFCGTRGMALPIFGLRVRLRGASATSYECFYAATFVNGASVGPMLAGEACEAKILAPIEAISVTIRPRIAAEASPPAGSPIDKPPPEPAPMSVLPSGRTVKDTKQSAAARLESDTPGHADGSKLLPLWGRIFFANFLRRLRYGRIFSPSKTRDEAAKK